MDVTPHFRGGKGEPLVLIHGFSATWRAWEPVLPALTARHEVLAATLAGHHGGPALDEGVEATIDALADGVERQLDEAGFATAHLVGNSLGGWIALDLARRGRAASVVGLAPAGGWEAGGAAERRIGRLFRRQYAAAKASAPLAETIARRPRLRRFGFREVCARGGALTPDLALASMRGVLGCDIYLDYIENTKRDGPPRWLGEVDAPVLIAWPEHDRILPEQTCSQGMRAIPGAQWRTLEGCGHVPMWDDPELVAGVILEFVGRHSGRLSAAGARAAGP